MPDLDAFEMEVIAHIKQLTSKDVGKRRKAAEWLGEAGDPTAITALKQAYKNDADPRVREAAAYSLGMFRKLEQELDGKDSDKVMKLLENVADGKMGGRVPISKRTVTKIVFALLLSAILLTLMAFVLPPIIKGGTVGGVVTNTGDTASNQAEVVTDKDRASLITDLRANLVVVNANADTLRGQYQQVLGGGDLACDQTFAPMIPAALSPNNTRDNPDLVEIANTINQAQTDFLSARTSYDQVCTDGQTLEPGAFGPSMAIVVALIQQLTTAGDALTAAESANVTVATPVPAGESPTAEVAPTTAAGVDIRIHLTALQAILDDVTALRGSSSLLNQYWNEASTSGATDGCRETPPNIPENYALPEDLVVSAPNLKLAVDLVNTGLGLLRAGWAQFTTACANATLGPEAPAGLTNMQNIQVAFGAASQQVAALRAQT